HRRRSGSASRGSTRASGSCSEVPMSIDASRESGEDAMRAARTAYEFGRVRIALVRAAVAATAVAAIALAIVGARALPWVVATFVTTAFVEWRGGVLARGARRGILAGLATLLLPLSI